jgi:hypothetical protein
VDTLQEARAGISSNVFHGVLASTSVISAYRNRALIIDLRKVSRHKVVLLQHRWKFTTYPTSRKSALRTNILQRGTGNKEKGNEKQPLKPQATTTEPVGMIMDIVVVSFSPISFVPRQAFSHHAETNGLGFLSTITRTYRKSRIKYQYDVYLFGLHTEKLRHTTWSADTTAARRKNNIKKRQ